ncbi:aryl hydrocarbon receptor-like isoform X1 [Sphaeramia orbicularis]|uniref:Aryl hydrocarbon receptor-like n=1 Tax=Sphaeramia orbicularis TaxID=375764 RepID=A0A673CA86_9TELE|nr:aryl hydrocarbon receptor-like isoform X1 [Sphaeramia orbicularis]
MLGNGGGYAVKRRKKPVQKNVKPPPVKTNPSKRHRDRLNTELDRLTSLLNFPEEVKSCLDKLSVLRLSVGYLKVKSYFHAALQKNACLVPSNGSNVSLDGVSLSEGELLLQALNGFVLVVMSDGTIFYTSRTIEDYLGFRQSDVVYQSVYDLIHMDDRELFKCQLHFALNPNGTSSEVQPNSKTSSSSSQSFMPQYIPPENSSFLERNFCCRVRCLLDNTSGFLALNFTGRLKYLHMQEYVKADGGVAHPQLALFAIAMPVQPPSVMEIRTKSLIFETKHRMDFAPMGIDARGKVVLGFSEMELVTVGSGYQFLHAADMMYCADNHLRMIKTGDSGFTYFRLLTKTGHWQWVQASARVVFKGERPDFIIARQKALTNEEGEEHLRQRRLQLPFNIATGEAVLYDISLDASIPGPPGSTAEKPLDPASLLGSLRQQDHTIYTQPQPPSPQLPDFTQIEYSTSEQPQQAFEQAFLDSHALLNVPGQPQTSQKRTSVEELTSEAMIESLEQILGDIGDGWAEDLEIEATELKEWENTLIRMNRERGDASRELNQILPNDVFSYVEEALRRETGGYLPGSDQSASHAAETVHSLSNQAQHVGSVQGMTDIKPNQNGTEQQTGLKGVFAGVSQSGALTQYANTHKGHSSLLWPSNSSTHHCDNQMVSTKSCHVAHPQPEVSHQTWLPSAQNTNSFHSSHCCRLEEMNQSLYYPVNHTQAGLVRGQSLEHTFPHPQSQGTSQQQCELTAWKQLQQLPQSFHRHTLTHSSHTSASVKPAAPSFQRSSQMQRISGSCKYGNREGHIPNSATVSTTQNRPLLGPPCSAGSTETTTNTPFIIPHSGMAAAVEGIWLAAPHEGTMQVAPCANISVGDLGGDGSGLNSAGSQYPTNHYSLDSSVGTLNQRSMMNDVVNPFTFSAFPNLSQNTGQ